MGLDALSPKKGVLSDTPDSGLLFAPMGRSACICLR